MNNQIKILTTALLTLLAVQAKAVDVDAGDYDVAPAGTSLALLYLQHATRDSSYVGSDKQAGHLKLESNIGIARFVHYTDIAGFRVAPQVLIPFGKLEGKGDISSLGDASGLGDIIVAAPVWLLNDAESKSYFGITPYLYLPTGDYSKNDALNIGENRYKLDVQAEYSTRITPKIAWDVAADVIFYGANDDIAGGGKLKQDVGYQLQTNTRYFLNDQWDLRAGLSYLDAGDTKLRGQTTDSYKQSKFWVGTAYSPTSTTNVILNYGRDFDVENGFKEDNRINLRLLKVF
ncbi:transporter [Acinetobacter sp. WCHAc060025]|uniref:transporter n=1 Tax=Acinetobacter sp. WCHAc060025 TaxID=2518625 RepID=UPI00102351AA|nr:transporter [Acinetobacter sp. WCHAc060025]RZG74073.1 transporter [Acinetobacter sp. WCHAc060025]